MELKIAALQDWLTKFGYLPPPDPITGQLQTQEELTKAIMVMQQFGGLEATGVLDEATFKLMKTPRCSLPDLAEAKSRKKRYTQGANKWKKRNLSWRVRTFPKDSHLGHDTVRALLYYALKVWSDITPLNFHEVAGEPKEKLEAPHLGNNLHGSSLFISDTEGMDLFAVAVHEFGHAIGLAHISATESIMRPYYQGPESENPCLRRRNPKYQTQITIPCCQISPRITPLFRKYFWRLTRNKHLVSLQPAQIHRFWKGLPLNLDSVDAVYERTRDHKIVFFKGDRYWVFKDNNVEEGYPRPISDFGLPLGGIDAAFSWAQNDKTYFFKDDLHWCYDDHQQRMEAGYPLESRLWKGIPSQLDDATHWSDVADSDLEAESGYPRSIAKDWLVCSDMQADAPEPAGRSRTRGRSQQGYHDESRSESEVCSCTSSSSDFRPHSSLRLGGVLVSVALWTAVLTHKPL
ncbi:hypothetical protein Chor_010647 [Crotalus horridus]